MALETRPYGKTGEKVTVIGLGGARLYRESFTDGVATVRRALELGVTYFDTSPGYGPGMSQAILGDALAGRSENYVLATKIGYLGSPARFRSYNALRAQIDDSLRLLLRDSVDTLQIHHVDQHSWWTDRPPVDERALLDPDYDFAGAPAIKVLQDAKTEGLCRFIGISQDSFDGVARILASVDLDTCLPAFSYDILRRGARREVFPIAQARGVAVILGGIFWGGRDVEVHCEWLTSRPEWMTPEMRDSTERLYAVQRECGLSMVELSIRYLLADSGFSTILVGAGVPAEIEGCVAAAEKGPLPADLHQVLEELGVA